MGSSSRRKVIRTAVVGAVAAALMTTYLAVPASATPAAPTQGQCGSNTATAPTITPSRTSIGENETATVTVTGANYLVPPHVCGSNVFGGIYLFFGWVKPGGQWGPSAKTSDSANGLFGQTYSYPGEGGGAETRDDGTGAVRLISFTQGGESGDSTPFHMDGAGNWQSDLIVRGSKFNFTDVMTGKAASVDCMVVQCGVFTIGAHGKSSRTNEQFHPINFTNAQGVVVAPSAPAAGGAGGSANPPASGPVTGAAPAGGGSNSNASGGSGSGSNGGGSGSTGDAATATEDTTAVGSVGEAPTDTAAAEVAGENEEARTDEDGKEIAATVQDFGDTGGGGGGAGPALWIGIIAALVVVIGGGTALVARKRRGATGASGA